MDQSINWNIQLTNEFFEHKEAENISLRSSLIKVDSHPISNLARIIFPKNTIV